jgi:purine-nucleoside phosphorylase
MGQATMAADPRREAVEALAHELRRHGVEGARIALVLGSGLGAFADRLEGARTVPYEELAGMPSSAVPGHAGRLVLGEVAGVPVALQQGRVHLYEGWTPFEVTRAVRAFAAVGVGAVVLTNAAGGLRPDWAPGTLMRLTDHVDQQRRSPLFPGEGGFGPVYDPEFGDAIDGAAEEAGVRLERGVYAGLLGPTYETPAEVRMFAALGADAVGMSTVCEAAAARAAGMRVAAVSCITNHAAGISEGALSHDEVMETGREAAEDFCRLVEAAVPRLDAALR